VPLGLCCPTPPGLPKTLSSRNKNAFRCSEAMI